MPDENIYDEYKPLRNYLRKVDLMNALGAIRWYINYLQLKSPPPPPDDLEIDKSLFMNRHEVFRIFLPWQLTVLAREVVINSPLKGHTKDFRRLHDFALGFNKLKAIEEHIEGKVVSEANIWHHFSKVLSHQQFVWQENEPNHQAWNRYYHIYSHPEMRPVFEQFFGLTVEKYFILSMLVWNNYITYLGFNYPPEIKLNKIGGTLDDYKKFIQHYSLPLEELQKRLEDPAERQLDYNFMKYYDSLKSHPLILVEVDSRQMHLCPIPTSLYWRTTDGIYYDLINETGFDQALGKAFNAYVGEVLKSNSFQAKTNIIDADSTMPASAPKPDWVLVQGDTTVFIECKSKRMTIGAKIEPTYSPVTGAQLKKLASSVVQCYQAVIDAKSRGYKFVAKVKDFNVVVVTLESWYISGEMAVNLRDEVIEELKNKGIDPTILDETPYTVLSAQDFENFIIALRSDPVAAILPPFFTDKQYEGWAFTSYLSSSFKGYKSGQKLFRKNHLTQAIEKLIGRPLDESNATD